MKARILLVVCLFCAGVVAIGAVPRAKRRPNNAQGVPAGWWTDGKGNWKSLPVGVGAPIAKSDVAPQMGAMMAPADALPSPPAPNPWVVNVQYTVKVTLSADDQTLYQNMANILSTVTTPPPARLTQYAAAIGSGWVATPWIGGITQVTPDGNGGNLINVGVDGMFYDGNGNIQGQAFTGYSEQWNVDVNGNPTFVQSFDPQNLAGQMPPMTIN
jgi:hypothetical protein